MHQIPSPLDPLLSDGTVNAIGIMVFYNQLTGLILAVIFVPRPLAADSIVVVEQTISADEHGQYKSNDKKILRFSIVEQPLEEAINAFIEVTDWQIGFNADLVEGLNGKAVNGRYSPEQALKLILQDSGLTYRITRDGIVIIVQKTDAPADIPTPIIEPKVSTSRKLVARLEEITVMGKTQIGAESNFYAATHASSATKTETPIREIPQSIHVIPRSLIEDQQTVTVSDSLRNVSGVIPNNSLLTPSFERTHIRGFPAEQLLDGFSQYYNPGDRDSTINVDRIEVLKGSTALLYSGGYGSPPGGLVNVISKVPHPLAFNEIGIKYGTNDFYQHFFDLNQPINDQVLFRINGEYTNSRGFVDVLKTERYNINPSLTLTDNDNTKFTLQGKVSKWEQQDYQGLPATGTVSGDFTIRDETFIGPKDIEPSHAEFNGVWGTLEHRLNDIWAVTFKARYTQSEFDQKVQSIFGTDGLQADQPFSRLSTWLLANAELFQEQQEMSVAASAVVEFTVGPSSNTVLFGADYSKIDDQGFIDLNSSAISIVNLAAPVFPVPYTFPGSRINNIFIKNTTYGGYVQLQSTIYERAHLLAGVRLGNVSIEYENKIPGFEFSVQTSKTKLLPRFGIVFDATNEFSLFASYSQGMRGHLYNNFRTSPKPELSHQIEAGLKFEFAGQLSGQFAVYQIDRSNVLVTDTVDGLPASFAEGEQRSRGFEVDLVWQVNGQLSVLAAYAYTEAKFTNERAGVPVDTPLPGIPEHSGRLWANYHFQLPPLKGLSIGAGIYAQSGVFLSNSHLFKTNSYYAVDTSIVYPIGQFRLGLSVKNLTDQVYFERLDYFGGRVGAGQGRSFFATASMEF